jgi:hypothetical protein
MNPTDFQIGVEFWSDGGYWRCTDIGTRTITAIKLDMPDDSWYNGPPYLIAESTFDEFDRETCYPTKELRDEQYPPDEDPDIDNLRAKKDIQRHVVSLTLEERAKVKAILDKATNVHFKRGDKASQIECRWLAEKLKLG